MSRGRSLNQNLPTTRTVRQCSDNWCERRAYANSEDENLYAINQGGALKKEIFQQLALGVAQRETAKLYEHLTKAIDTRTYCL